MPIESTMFIRTGTPLAAMNASKVAFSLMCLRRSLATCFFESALSVSLRAVMTPAKPTVA